MKSLEKFPVTKNGKFFGYADAEQIAANESLEIFDESKAAAEEAKGKVKAAAEKKASADAGQAAAEKAGADATAVKKAPAK